LKDTAEVDWVWISSLKFLSSFQNIARLVMLHLCHRLLLGSQSALN